MAVEVAMWNIDTKPRRLSSERLDLESRLEALIDSDPMLLGQQMLVVGRQVATPHGKFIDLLAMDLDGSLHVVELKRDRTPRDVVAQVLDYASWVSGLGGESIREIFRQYRPHEEFDVAFDNVFGQSPPDDLNEEHGLMIVASSLDPGSERIVEYLASRGVPINVALFQYFRTDDHEYIVRTWLVEQQIEATVRSAATRRSPSQAEWNGRDWYVAFGEHDERDTGRRWADAVRYGFVSGGGAPRYSSPIRNLPINARVFAYIPQRGYVGVGTVVGASRPAIEVEVDVNGTLTPLLEAPLVGKYLHENESDTSRDNREWVTPVEWEGTRSVSEAFRTAGLFANQNTACKLRSQFTIDEVTHAFGLDA